MLDDQFFKRDLEDDHFFRKILEEKSTSRILSGFHRMTKFSVRISSDFIGGVFCAFESGFFQRPFFGEML